MTFKKKAVGGPTSEANDDFFSFIFGVVAVISWFIGISYIVSSFGYIVLKNCNFNSC